MIVDVKEGSRKTPVGEAQLAQLRDVQDQMNQNVLGQMVAGGNPGFALPLNAPAAPQVARPQASSSTLASTCETWRVWAGM